jgi:hypothetical protein
VGSQVTIAVPMPEDAFEKFLRKAQAAFDTEV